MVRPPLAGQDMRGGLPPPPLDTDDAVPMPIPQALTNPAKFEKEFLRYLVNPLPASIVIAVMEILSTHAENEHYITVRSVSARPCSLSVSFAHTEARALPGSAISVGILRSAIPFHTLPPPSAAWARPLASRAVPHSAHRQVYLCF